ncbi:MAG: hypothetical protein AAB657_01735 [Patescibacteria group bacterium]
MASLTNILLVTDQMLNTDTLLSKVLTLTMKYQTAQPLRLKQFSCSIETLVGAYNDIKKILSEDEYFSAVIFHNTDSSLNKPIIAFFEKWFGVRESNICILPELGVGGWKILEEFISKWQQKLPETDPVFIKREAATNELFQFD